MIHPTRVFCVGPCASAEELAKKLVDYSWTLCTGFEYAGLLFLNDSFSGDGPQEYAVIRAGRQVESITFGWCTFEQALALIQWLEGGGTPEDAGDTDLGPVTVRTQAPQAHRCALCA